MAPQEAEAEAEEEVEEVAVVGAEEEVAVGGSAVLFFAAAAGSNDGREEGAGAVTRPLTQRKSFPPHVAKYQTMKPITVAATRASSVQTPASWSLRDSGSVWKEGIANVFFPFYAQ